MNASVFVCPSCGQHIEVDDSMRDAILRAGCPVCASEITSADFPES